MSVAEELAKYSYSLSYDDLDARIVHEAKRRIIDTVACAIGAFDAEPVKIVRDFSRDVSTKKAATIFGAQIQTTPELATFVNTTMSRYLDFMDTYFYNGEYVHPEDNIASIIAVAESEKRTGKDVILAIVMAFEACCRLAEFANIRKRGWDHVIWLTISSTLAVSRLMGLPTDKTAQAISIGITNNIPLRQIRVGGLSMWKALAVADSTMAGVFAVNLAGRGITGPEQVFEGKNGFFNQVTGATDLSVDKFCRSGANFKILESHIKKYPAEYNSQSAIEAALDLRKKIGNRRNIKGINIRTFTPGYEIIADKEKWYPANRETADHSLPYIVCVALVDGEITEKQFSEERIADPELRALVRKVDVRPDPECDKDYYPGTPSIVEVVMDSGERYSSKVIHPRGSYRNPMSDQEIEEKFKNLVNPYLTPGQIGECLEMLWNLEKQADISKLVSKFVVKSGFPPTRE